MKPQKPKKIFTVGHSNRTPDDLVAVLRRQGIQIVADVRTVPRSKAAPGFDGQALAERLPRLGITYHHLKELGGLGRTGLNRSPNTALPKNRRAYADYMLSDTFAKGLMRLETLAAIGPVATLCAEADWTACHRALLADALTLRGFAVVHLGTDGDSQPHRLTPGVTLLHGKIIYPAVGEQLTLL